MTHQPDGRGPFAPPPEGGQPGGGQGTWGQDAWSQAQRVPGAPGQGQLGQGQWGQGARGPAGLASPERPTHRVAWFFGYVALWLVAVVAGLLTMITVMATAPNCTESRDQGVVLLAAAVELLDIGLLLVGWLVIAVVCVRAQRFRPARFALAIPVMMIVHGVAAGVLTWTG